MTGSARSASPPPASPRRAASSTRPGRPSASPRSPASTWRSRSGPEIIAVGVLSIAAGVLYTGGPQALRLRGPRRGLRLRLLRARRRQRLLLRAARATRPGCRSCSRSRSACSRRRSSSSTTSATSTPTAAPASAPSPSGSGGSAPADLYAAMIGAAYAVLPLVLLAGDALGARPARPVHDPARAEAAARRPQPHRRPGAERGAGADGRPARRPSRLLRIRRPGDPGLACAIARRRDDPVALPFRERYRTARGELDAREMAVVRLHTDEATEGLGEAVPLSLRGGAGARAGASRARALRAGARRRGAARPRPRTPLAAGSTSCWRAAAAAAPARRRWRRSTSPCTTSPGRSAGCRSGGCSGAWKRAGPLQRHARRRRARGRRGRAAAELATPASTTFKVKVGTGDGRRAGRRRPRGAAAGATHPGRRQRRLGARTRPSRADWELGRSSSSSPSSPAPTSRRSPGPRRHLDCRSSPTRASPRPPTRSRPSRSGACDAVTVKLAKVGGIREALRIAAVVPTYLSSALDGPIGIAAAAHSRRPCRATATRPLRPRPGDRGRCSPTRRRRRWPRRGPARSGLPTDAGPRGRDRRRTRSSELRIR